MDTSLTQRQRNFRVEIRLHQAMIDYKVKRMHEEVEAFIPYEQLSGDTITKAEKYSLYLLMAYAHFFGFLLTASEHSPLRSPLFAVFLGACTLVHAFLYWYTRNRFIILRGEKYNIHMLANAEGRRFMEIIKERRREYLKSAYGKINWENSTDTELNRFRHMNSLGIISDEEFDRIKNQILNK